MLEVPDAVAVRQRFQVHPTFRLDADLEPVSYRLSRGRGDGATVRMRRADAIFPKLKLKFRR